MPRILKAKMIEGWGVLVNGQCVWAERLPLSSHAIFVACVVDTFSIAVVLDLSGLSEGEILQIQHSDLPWPDGVVLVRSVRLTGSTAVIEILGEKPSQQAIAVAAACSAFDAGLFDVVPTEYRVSNGAETLIFTLQFDEDSESWLACIQTKDGLQNQGLR